MFMDLSEKNVLFVGAGHVNTGRIKTMLDFVGSITVVSPDADASITALDDEGRIILRRRRFDERDLDGADIVITATGHAGTDVRIAGMCRRRGIMVNAASDKTLCDFYFPGIARRDPLVVGVTASGEDHSLAAKASAYFRKILGDKRDD
jgi:siroheme synthase-like protein